MTIPAGLPVVLVEPLSLDEEYDFLAQISAALTGGELSEEEAQELIDREYALWETCNGEE